MARYNEILHHLAESRYHWLVTGVAGFVGSNLLESLLRLDQKVTGIDNFSTGSISNLAQVEKLIGPKKWPNFKFINGDIRNLKDCVLACDGIDFVLHQAALGSVSRSINDPISTNESNVTGFLNVLVAARDCRVRRFVYAASSSTYGDHPGLPKVEDIIGKPLSPYAVTKYVNELYADVFSRSYGVQTIGLRYFNVFGKRQDPSGSYAAVIPQWLAALIKNHEVRINGDGETSRDFCFVDNVIQANLLASFAAGTDAINEVYNIAAGDRTSLNTLYSMMRNALADRFPHVAEHRPTYVDFRPGDIRHSQADISKAKKLLGYEPSHRIQEGLAEAMEWYVAHLA